MSPEDLLAKLIEYYDVNPTRRKNVLFAIKEWLEVGFRSTLEHKVVNTLKDFLREITFEFPILSTNLLSRVELARGPKLHIDTNLHFADDELKSIFDLDHTEVARQIYLLEKSKFDLMNSIDLVNYIKNPVMKVEGNSISILIDHFNKVRFLLNSLVTAV